MFENVLVAVDGSQPSRKALDYALELAKKFQSRITVIHVYSKVVPLISAVDTPPAITSPAATTMAAKIADEAERKAKQILEEAERIVKEKSFIVEGLLKEGDVVKEIVAAAHEKKIDLIVIGHKGWGRLTELLLGSVSEGVGHKAPCPVLIVK